MEGFKWGFKPKQRNLLKQFSTKYIWWKNPEESMLMPERVIAQVMNIGDYTDVQELADKIGDTVLREGLTNAQAGQFNERSWTQNFCGFSTFFQKK